MKTAANPEVAVQRFLSGFGEIKSKLSELHQLREGRSGVFKSLRKNGCLEQALLEEMKNSVTSHKIEAYEDALLILKNEQLL